MAYHNLLLIDDDEDDHEIFLTATAEVSPAIRCTCFYDASEALEKLSVADVKPDVIFLDLNMPVMNGQQFLTEIKQRDRLKHIPVIIFTTSSHPNTVATMKALGAQDFITKPGLYHDLVSLLKPILT